MLTGFFCAALCALAPGQVMIDSTSRVWMNGGQVGAYVDNEAPEQGTELAAVPGFRLAGIAPYARGLPPYSGTIRLREFYPRTLRERPRRGDGYILPASFHWADEPAYSMRWRREMWCAVKKRHPIMVIWYGWNDRVGPRVQTMMRRPCPRPNV